MPLNRTAALATCYTAMATLAISINLLPVCLPLLKTGFNGRSLTDEELGRLVAMTFFGLVAGVLIAGPLANRYRAKYFAVGGAVFIALGLALLGFAHTYAELIVAVGVMGFGGGVLDMILSPIVCAIQPEKRTQALNWLHSFYCVGAVITILLATLALAWINWQQLALAMVTLPVVVTILLCGVSLPPILHESVERTRVRDLLLRPFFLLVLGAIFLGGAAEMGMAQWLPAFAELDLKLPVWMGGAGFLAFSIAMTLGRMAAGHFGHRMSVYRMVGWSCASTAVLFVVAGFCPLPWLALGAAIMAGFTGSCLWPSMLGFAGDRYPQAGASMYGLLAAVGNFGGVILPWGVGLIADKSRIGVGLVVAALCPLLMLELVRRMKASAARD